MSGSSSTENKINPGIETEPGIGSVRVVLKSEEETGRNIEKDTEEKSGEKTDQDYGENLKQFEAELEREGRRFVIKSTKTISDFSEIEKVLGKNLKSRPEEVPDMGHLRTQFKKALNAFIAHQVEKLNKGNLTPEEIDLAIENLSKYVKISEGVKLFDLKTTIETGFFRDPELMTRKIDKFIDWHRRSLEGEMLPKDDSNPQKETSGMSRWKKEYVEPIMADSDINADFKDPAGAMYFLALTERCLSLRGERKSLEKIKNPNEHAKKRLEEVTENVEDIEKELLNKGGSVEKVSKTAEKIFGKYAEEFNNLEIVSRLNLLDMTERGRKIKENSFELHGLEEIMAKLEKQLSKSNDRIEKRMSLKKMRDLIFVDIFRKMARDCFMDSREIKKLSDLDGYEAVSYLSANKDSEVGKMYEGLAFLFGGEKEIKPETGENMGQWLKRALPKAIEARRITSL